MVSDFATPIKLPKQYLMSLFYRIKYARYTHTYMHMHMYSMYIFMYVYVWKCAVKADNSYIRVQTLEIIFLVINSIKFECS